MAKIMRIGRLGVSLQDTFKRILSLAMPASVASMVVFGDSITAGQNAVLAADRWANIVSTAMGATLLNQGIAGTVLQNSNDSTLSPRANNGRDRYISALTGANKKAMCIIAYGFNDARYIGAPATFNLAEYENDYREILTGLLASGYTAGYIVIVSPYYITDTGLATGSAGFAGQTRAAFEGFVASAYALALEFGVYYAETYARMRDNGGATLIDTDNIHPKNNGHLVIADAVMAARRVALPEVPAFTGAFMTDTFTDTNTTQITAHTADLGGAWSAQTGYTPGVNSAINNNKLVAGSSTATYRNAVAAPSADYYVEGVFDFLSTITSDNQGVTGRASASANTFYFARWTQTAGFQLWKCVAGVNTQLGTTFADTFTSGSRTVRLTMLGSTISMSIDGVVRVSVTDTAITAAGHAGIRSGLGNSNTTGIHLNSITAVAI